MTQLQFPLYYRQHGVRRITELISPHLREVTSLPRNTTLHYLQSDPEMINVDTTDPILSGYSKKISIYYPPALTQTRGNATRNSVMLPGLVMSWHKEHNRHFRRVLDEAMLDKDPQSLTIYNYNYLNRLYRYPVSPMEEYYKWSNVQATAWATIGHAAKVSSRNQFIFLDIPKDLPSRTYLDIFSRKESLQLLKIFDTPEKLFLLEIWKWIDPATRESSVLHTLTPHELSSVTVIFKVKPGKFLILNLGYLSSWIKGNKPDESQKNAQQFNPDQIKKVVLKMFVTLDTMSKLEEIPEEVLMNNVDQGTATDVDADEVVANGEKTESDVIRAFAPTKTDKVTIKSMDDLGDGDYDEIDLNKLLDSIEGDLALVDRISERKTARSGLVVKSGDVIEEAPAEAPEVTVADIESRALVAKEPSQVLKDRIEARLEAGYLTGSEYRKILADADKINVMKDPFTGSTLLTEAATIKPEDLVIDEEAQTIPDSGLAEDKSILKSSLLVYDKKYLSKIKNKDILRAITSFQRAGIIIRGVEAKTQADVLGSFTTLKIDMKPIEGNPSTIYMRIPEVLEDGSFVSSGNKYLMRKQIIDLPIKKISATEVALSSSYGKNFIQRNTKKAKSAVEWIDKKVTLSVLTGEGFVKKSAAADVYNNTFKAPYIYNAMASKYSYVQTKDVWLSFDERQRTNYATPEQIAILEKNGERLAGYTSAKKFITVDEAGVFYAHEGTEKVSLGNIYTVLGLDEAESPVDFVDMRIFRAQVPVGLYLSYVLGFENLIKLLRAPYRFVEGRKQKDLKPHEYAITLKEGSLVFDKGDRRNTLILAGLLEFDKELKKISMVDLNSKGVYLNLLEAKGMTASHIREMDNLTDLFLDPVTIDVLRSMNMPETFNGLLLKAAEMLTFYEAPDETDVSQMRIRGYERLSSFIYKEMANSIRQYRSSNFGGRTKINMSPWAVWRTIMEDQTIKIVEDINPLQNVKEVESLTYSGEGGRSRASMPKSTREYHPSAVGFISEATVDSSDVGINVFLSTDPGLKDMRGLIKPNRQANPAQALSISAICAPGSTRDDMKRVGFVSIQQAHTVFANGYHAPQVRTGGESTVPHRTSDMFCTTAKMDGIVANVDDQGITVQYSDGSVKGIPLGRQYGKAEGSIYPHSLVTKLKPGQKFKKGAVISFNEKFFETDNMDPSSVVMKNSMTMRVALVDGKDSYEDSCAIASNSTKDLASQITKVRSFTVDFRQSLMDVVKVGTKVGPKDLLMLIRDEISTNLDAFDEGTMQTLRNLSSQKARSKYLGQVERVEIYYHGDKADMSESLRALADRSDRMLSAEARALGKPAVSGHVTDEYRVEGVPLGLDKAEVKFFVTIDVQTGTGDKLVFANQMKCTVGRVIEQPVRTLSGRNVDAIFGFRGFGNRIVTSPIRIGTSITVLNLIAEKAVQIYEGSK